jgi:hypothetical protein
MVGSKHHQIRRAWGGTLPWAAFNFSLCSHHPHPKKNPATSSCPKNSDAKLIGGAAAKNLLAWGSRKFTANGVHTFMQQNYAKISYI